MLHQKRLWNANVYVVGLLLFISSFAICGENASKTAEFVSGSWSLVLLPDTQVYAEQYPGLFALQTHWIAKNKDKFNIRYVFQLGDVTNQNTVPEWQRAREAMCELDGVVPYAIAVGNHDSGARLNEYFPLSKLKRQPGFGGCLGHDVCNCYHLFSAGGIDWILIVLEYTPREKVVQWANQLLAKHPERKAILLTHTYLRDNAARDRALPKPHADCRNSGEDMWQKLVRKNNFALTINGHICQVGFLSSKNDRGRTTHQMLVDYQMRKLGGEGYLRILEFLPDGKTVRVKSYSPLYDKYLTDPGNQFSFVLDIP